MDAGAGDGLRDGLISRSHAPRGNAMATLRVARVSIDKLRADDGRDAERRKTHSHAERGNEDGGLSMTTAEAPTSEAVPPAALRFLRSLSGPVIGLAVVLALFIGLIGADPSPGKLAKFLSIDNLQI